MDAASTWMPSPWTVVWRAECETEHHLQLLACGQHWHACRVVQHSKTAVQRGVPQLCSGFCSRAPSTVEDP